MLSLDKILTLDISLYIIIIYIITYIHTRACNAHKNRCTIIKVSYSINQYIKNLFKVVQC